MRIKDATYTKLFEHSVRFLSYRCSLLEGSISKLAPYLFNWSKSSYQHKGR